MSLIHWWPLNGDTLDYIGGKNGSLLGDANVTTIGKIGKCLSGMEETQTVAGVSVPNCNLTDELTSNYSFACWFRIHGTHVHYNGTIMSSGNWNKQAWAVGIDQSNSKIDVFDNKYNNWVNIGYTLTNEKWYHLASVFQNGVSFIYLNGELIGSRSSTPVQYSDATNLTIGRETYANGYFSFNGDICDVRVYNHALSQAEVKELSRALIVHYTFNDVFAETTTNIIKSIKSAHGRSSLYGNGVKIDWSVDTGDSFFMFNYSPEIKADSIYTLSFDCEGLKSGEEAAFAVSNLKDGSYIINLQNGKNVLTFTAGADLMNDIESHDSRLFFDDKTKTAGAVFYLTNFQLEERDHATPYASTIRKGLGIIDESGYNHPTELYNNCELTTDTNSGSFALHTTGLSGGVAHNNCSYLKGDIGTLITPTEFTICFNAKVNQWGAQTSGVLSLNISSNEPTEYLASTFVQYDGNFRLNSLADSTQANIGSGIITLGEWHHYAFVWNGSKLIGYKDGVQYNTSVSAEFTVDPFRYIYLGYDRAGSLGRDADVTWGDFRLYMTALSEQDVKKLVKTKAYITDKGDIETHQFIEESAQIVLTDKYNFECEEVYESFSVASKYDKLEYIEATGTQYIDTGTAPGTSLSFDLEITNPEGYILTQSHYGLRTSGNTLINFVSGKRIRANQALEVDRRNYVQGSNESLMVNGIAGYQETDNDTPSGNVKIFSGASAGKGRIHKCCIMSNNEILRYYIPVKRKSDQTLGLLDIVHNVFYTNAGTGTFVAGPVADDEKTLFYETFGVLGREIIEI